MFAITLLNAGAFFGGLSFLKKGQTETAADGGVELLEPLEPILSAIAALEEKAQATEVDFNDPRFNDETLFEAAAQLKNIARHQPDAASNAEAASAEKAASSETGGSAPSEEQAAEALTAEDGEEHEG